MSKTLDAKTFYIKNKMIQPYLFANIHERGARDYQEDSFVISDIGDLSKGVLLLLADGMGGMADGKEMSEESVDFLMKEWKKTSVISDPPSFWKEKVLELARVMAQKNSEKVKPGGSTLLLVHIIENSIYYLSVGDSRIALYRNGILSQLNKEHNFYQTLKKLVEIGEITEEEAASNRKRNALTSFIGMEDELKIDQNTKPIPFLNDDEVLLMSDGIFNTLPMSEIEEILRGDFYEAADIIREKILHYKKPHQDNFTAIFCRNNI